MRCGFAVSCDASVSATFTYLDATSDSAFTIENPSVDKVLRNLASHPLVFSSATDGLSASAHYEIFMSWATSISAPWFTAAIALW